MTNFPLRHANFARIFPAPDGLIAGERTFPPLGHPQGIIMRLIGLIGGMSWESTAVYYRRVNEQIRDRLGGLHSADVIMRSLNFEDIVAMQKADQWDAAADTLSKVASELEAAGAGCILICTNTMHKLADAVQARISIPLINIIDVTAEALKAAGAHKPLLLATRYTMEQDFYLERMRSKHGLSPAVPEEADRMLIHNIIFDELCCGIIKDSSRRIYLEAIEKARADGVDSVILGCTEIGLLIGPQDVALPTFDSTLLHADRAVDFALQHGGGPRLAAA